MLNVSANCPAGNPSGPAWTRLRKIAKRDSCANAASDFTASVDVIFFMSLSFNDSTVGEVNKGCGLR